VKHRAIIIIAAFLFVIAGIGAKVLLNPLRRSEDGIQRWLLRQTPLGSSREQVLVVAARRGWQVHQEYRGRFINKSVSAGGLEQSSAAM